MRILSTITSWALLLGAFLVVGGLLLPGTVEAQSTCYAVSSGMWEESSNWADQSGGSGGNCSQTQGYPSASDENAVLERAAMDIDVDTSTTLTVGNITISSDGGIVRPENKDFDELSRTVDAKDITVNSSSSTSKVTTQNGTATLIFKAENIDNFSNIDVGNGTIQTTGFFDNDGDVTITSQGLLDANGEFTTRSGASLDIGNGTFQIEGNFSNSGNFSSSTTSGFVNFNGNGPQSLTGDFSGGNAFYDVQVGQDAEVNPEDNSTIENNRSVRIDGNLTVKGKYGSGDTEKADLTFKGNTFEVKSSADFFANTIRFNSSASTGVSGTVFSNVNVTNNTDVSLDASFTINGKLTIESDKVEVTTSPLTLNGDVSIADGAVLDPKSNAIVMSGMGRETDDGDNTQNIVGDAVQNFGNLTIRDTTGDGNSTTETRVRFSGSDNELDVNQFTINEAEVLSGRPVFIEGDFTAKNNGTFTFDNATRELVKFDGGSQQTLDSPTSFTFNVVEIAAGTASSPDVEITSTSSLAIPDTLILSQGVLGPNGGLTMPSGSVINYQGGDISGSITAERELTGTSASWYAVSPATKNTSLKSFEESGPDDIWTSGNPNADNTQADSGSVTWYDETVSGTKDKGYQFPDLTTTYGPETGTFYYIYDGTKDNLPVTLGAVGEPRTSSSFTSFSLSFTNSAESDSEDGWNLISNPYLAVVDWDDFDLSSTCVDNTVYLHEPGTGDGNTYSALTYTAGSGSSGSLFEEFGYIAPFQSFWVKTTCDPSSFGISDITTAQVTEKDRTADGASTNDPFQKSGSSEEDVGLLQLAMDKDTLTSKTLFAFRDGATEGKDAWDAYGVQFQGSTDKTLPRIQLHSVLENGKALQTSTLPAQFENETSFPISTTAKGCESGSPYSGEATLRWPMLQNLPADWGLVLKDTETGDKVNMRKDNNYTFTIEGSTSSSTCAKKVSSKSTSSAKEVPGPPSPEVVTHQSSKASSSSTRFELIIKPNAALPVEFSSINGSVDDQDAVLTWKTASETNNAGFQVQRKTDGAYTDLEGAFVESKAQGGTTNQPLSYRYRVTNLDAGEHTFRLKQVDTDGSSSFSDPIDVNVGLAGDYNFTTYPNPVSERATVEFAVKEKEEVTIALYNTLGQRVKTIYRDTPPAEQTRQIALDTDGLSSGLYILRLQSEGVSATQRITVVK